MIEVIFKFQSHKLFTDCFELKKWKKGCAVSDFVLFVVKFCISVVDAMAKIMHENLKFVLELSFKFLYGFYTSDDNWSIWHSYL